jgi:hypothetical protein
MVAGSNLICARNRFRASHDGPPNRHGHAGGRCRVPLLKRPPLSVVTIFESMRPAFFRASYCCLRRVVLVGQSSLCGGSLTGSGDLALHRLLRKLRGYGASGMAWTRPAYHLAIEPDWAHAAVWGKISGHTIHVKQDMQRPGRYRWEIHDGPKLRDSSLHNFASKREAQADSDLYFQRLIATWAVVSSGG